MNDILTYIVARWPSLIVTALYAVPVFAYRFLVAKQYGYPKRILLFTVLFILLSLSVIVYGTKTLMILWVVEHAVVLLIHYFFWLRNIIKKRPIGSPEGGYVTVALAFIVQIIPFIHFYISLSAG